MSILQKSIDIRNKYLPKPLDVGDCCNVALVVGYLLQKENHEVHIVTGMHLDCMHIWIEVDGEQIDPARDCVGLGTNLPLVDYIGLSTHKPSGSELLNINDYVPEDKFITYLEGLLNETK